MLRVEVKFMEERVFGGVCSATWCASEEGGVRECILCEEDPNRRQICGSQELFHSLPWLPNSVWESLKNNWYSEVWGFRWISFLFVCSSLPPIIRHVCCYGKPGVDWSFLGPQMVFVRSASACVVCRLFSLRRCLVFVDGS